MSKGLKKAVTKIIEQVRIDLDITRDEYAFCEYVQFRASDPRQKRPGWCTDNRDEIANFVGVSRKGLYKMAKRMEDRNLLEIGAAGDIRVTAKWVDLQAAGKETNQIPAPRNGYLVPKSDGPKPDHNGNLVPTQWELSTQTDGNLVPETIIINVEHDNKHEEIEVKTTTTTENGTSPVNPEISQKKGMVAPPAAAGPAVDVAAELERLRADQSARENFTLTRRIPAANFDAYVTAFFREVSATAETYWKVADLRRHFFNWSGTRYEIECKNQKPGASPAPGRPRDMVQL